MTTGEVTHGAEHPTYAEPPARPGAAALAHLVLAEIRMVVRDTAGLVVPVGMPVLILVMFGLSAAGQALPDLPGLTALDIYVVPLVLVMVMAMVGVVNMPSFLAAYRKTGILRRLSVTPLHPAMVLVAQVITSVLQASVGIGLALLTAHLMFGLNAPREPLVVAGVVVLVAAAMYAVGMLIAAVSPTPNASVALGLVAFLGIGAVGGMFGPVENLPTSVARVGEVLPFGAGVQAMQAGWAGTGVDPLHLVALGAATVLSTVASAVWFRWV